MLTLTTLAAIVLPIVPTASIGVTSPRTVSLANVHVVYEQVNPDYARAIAEICQSAREVYAQRFGCDMPGQLTVRVQTGWRGGPQLFSNGRDALTLRLEHGGQLAGSGGGKDVHYLYGLCREVGQIAMQRSLGRARWLSTTARQGWCHYAGSVVVWLK